MFRATEFLLVLCASFVLTWACIKFAREPQVPVPAATQPKAAAGAPNLAKPERAPDHQVRAAHQSYVRVVLPEPRLWTDPVRITAR